MRENVTKLDFESAFKALDELDIPVVGGLRRSRPIIESYKHVDRFKELFEDFYDVTDKGEMEQAQNDRAEDIAQAKLNRIERIVDLDAESPEDILPSYVGKTIIQCPNCLNLFYKDPEDIEHDEDNPDLVNIAEVCQHCGNDSGYNLIGKVAADEPEEEAEEENQELELEPEEEGSEEGSEEEATSEEGEDADLDLSNLVLDDFDEEEGEKVEESLSLNESVDEEEELADEEDVEPEYGEELSEGAIGSLNKIIAGLRGDRKAKAVTEGADDRILNRDNADHMGGVSKAEFDNWLDFVTTLESYDPKAEQEADASTEDAEEIDEKSLNEHFSKFLTDVYSNVSCFEANVCEDTANKFIVEGVIKFNSGKQKKATINFDKTENNKLVGVCEALQSNNNITLNYSVNNGTLLTESVSYHLTIDNQEVSGLTE